MQFRQCCALLPGSQITFWVDELPMQSRVGLKLGKKFQSFSWIGSQVINQQLDQIVVRGLIVERRIWTVVHGEEWEDSLAFQSLVHTYQIVDGVVEKRQVVHTSTAWHGLSAGRIFKQEQPMVSQIEGVEAKAPREFQDGAYTQQVAVKGSHFFKSGGLQPNMMEIAWGNGFLGSIILVGWQDRCPVSHSSAFLSFEREMRSFTLSAPMVSGCRDQIIRRGRFLVLPRCCCGM